MSSNYAFYIYEVYCCKIYDLASQWDPPVAFSDLNTRRGNGEKFARSRSKRVEEYRADVRGGNSQVGRKYVIRNLVSCIGKSSYYSTRIPVARCPVFPLSPHGSSFLTSSFILPPGGDLGRPVARRYFYSNFSRSSRSSSRDPPLLRRGGHRIMPSRSRSLVSP